MLDALRTEASACTKCRLHEGRTQVVFGNGNPDADLMFVGEAPGFHEDQQASPSSARPASCSTGYWKGSGWPAPTCTSATH